MIEKLLGFSAVAGVAYWAYRYLCYLFARGDAKGVPGGGVYWNRYRQHPHFGPRR